MSWYPSYSNIVRESFNDYAENTGFQVIGNGSVYLLPQYTGNRSYGSRWPIAPLWSFINVFEYSGYNSGQYLSATGNTSTNDYVNNYGSYIISSQSGQSSYIALTTGSSSFMTGISDKMSLEFKIRAESSLSSQSGITGVHGLGCFIRTSLYQEYIEFSSSGVHFHYHPELDFPIDLTRRKTFRVGLSGSSLYVFADTIRGFAALNKFNQSAVHTNHSGALISFGNPYLSSISGSLSGFSGSLYLDSLKVYNDIFALDEAYISAPSYTTNIQTAYTDPIIFPTKIVSLDYANIYHSGSYGTTSVVLERKSNASGTWAGLVTGSIVGSSPVTIDLSDVLPLKNGSEQYRFAIKQNSADGLNPPRSATEIVFASSFEENPIKIGPDWGPSYGQNIISLILDNSSWTKYPTPIDNDKTVFLLDDFPSQTYLYDAHSGYSGNLNGSITVLTNQTKVTNYANFSTGAIENYDMSGPFIEAGPSISQYTSSGLPTGLSGGIYGEIASGNYYVVSGQMYDDVYLSKYIRYDQSGAINCSQYIYCNTTGVGFGLYLTGMLSGSNYLFKGDIQLAEESNVYIKHSNNTWNLYNQDYIENNKFAIVFQSTGTSNSIEVLSSNSGSAFILDNFELYGISGGHYRFTGNITYTGLLDSSNRRYENLYVDSKLKLLAAPINNLYIMQASASQSLPLNSGFMLYIDNNRKPIFSVSYNYGASGSGNSLTNGSYVTLTGSKSIPIDEDIYLSAGIYSNNYSGLINNAAIYLAYNGQINAIKNFDIQEDLSYLVTGYAPVLKPYSGNTVIISGGGIELDYVRIQSLNSANPEYTSRNFAHIGSPYFRSNYWYEPSGSNYLMFRSQNDGGLVSDSPNQSPFFINHPDGWITFSDIGTYGLVNTFNKFYSGNARCYVPTNIRSSFTGSSGSFAIGTWITWDGISGSILGIGNPTTNYGFNFDIDNNGNLLIHKILNGADQIFSIGTIGTGAYDTSIYGISGYIIEPKVSTHIGIVLNNTGNNYLLSFYKDGARLINEYALEDYFNGDNPLKYSYTNSGGWIYSIASNYSNTNYSNISVEETWIDANYLSYTGSGIWETIASGSTDKSVSRDTIYINDIPASGNKIASPNRNQKYIIMPSGENSVTISCGINNYIYGGLTGHQGHLFYNNSLYKYINMYSLDISKSSISNYLGAKNSVFTVLNTVPGDSLNLAYISTEDFNTDNGTSFIDLSYRDIQNISNYNFGEYTLDLSSSGTSGTITGKKWTYSGEVNTDDIVITSLVYSDSYLNIGDYLYYYYLIGDGKYTVFSKSNNILDIKSSIKLIDNTNNLIDPKIFPWDIHVSFTDLNNNALPSGQSMVFILTKYPYIKDNTIWVEYNAGIYNSTKTIYAKKEILNTSKIYKENEDYSLSYLSGNWNLIVDNMLSADSTS